MGVWKWFQKQLIPGQSMIASVLNHPGFQVARRCCDFAMCIQKGIHQHYCLYTSEGLLTEQQVIDKIGNYPGASFQYLQISIFFYKDKKHVVIFSCHLTIFESLLVSYTAILIIYYFEYERTASRIRWEKYLNQSISHVECKEIKLFNNTFSANLGIKENSYKMLQRWNFTPVRLARMFPGTARQYWKCGPLQGLFMHMWWVCPKIQTFWLCL